MPETSDYQPQRAATRAPVGRPIRLFFDDAVDPVDGECVNISLGGMYIAVAPAQPKGSLVRFELRLDEEQKIRGLGEVAWMRAIEEGDTPPGMGIDFRYMEQEDRQQVYRLVSYYIRERLARRHAVTPEPSWSPPPLAPIAPAEPVPVAEESLEKSLPAEDRDGPEEDLAGRAQAMPSSLPEIEEALALEVPSVGEVPEPVLESEPISTRPPEEVVRWGGEPEVLEATSATPSERSFIFGQEEAAPHNEEIVPRQEERLLGTGAFQELPTGPLEIPRDVFPPAVERAETASDLDLSYHAPPPDGDLALGRRRRERQAPLTWVLLAIIAAALIALFFFSRRSTDPPVAPAPGVDGGAVEAPSQEVSENSVESGSSTETTVVGSSGSRFRNVTDVTWGPSPRGLRVIVAADGEIPQGRFRHFRLDQPSPREVVVLQGVGSRFEAKTLEVGGPVLRQIRAGYHDKAGVRELHLVLDLLDPEARLLDVRPAGARLVLVVGQG